MNGGDQVRYRRAGPFIGAVVSLGAIWLVAGTIGIDPSRLDVRTVVLLAVVAAVAQRIPVQLFRSSAISVAFGATIATYVLYGVGIALWVNLASAVVSAFTPKPKPLHKALFNAGALTVAASLAAMTYQAAGGHVPPTDPIVTIFAVAVSGLVYFFSNSALTGAVIALTTPGAFIANFRAVWRQNYSWMVVNYTATAVNGAALALAYQSIGFVGLALFLLPLAAAWYSFNAYMHNSRDIRTRNEQLQHANAKLAETNANLEHSTISVVGTLIEAITPRGRGRGVAIAASAVATARRLGLPEAEITEVHRAALASDLASLGVPAHVFLKPREMSGMAEQILTVGQTYRALTTDGADGRGLERRDAIAELRRDVVDLSPAVVDAFAAVLEEEERAKARGAFAYQPAAGGH